MVVRLRVSDILLSAKTHIPPLQRTLVSRSYLVQRLAEGIARDKRLTLVSAPCDQGRPTCFDVDPCA